MGRKKTNVKLITKTKEELKDMAMAVLKKNKKIVFITELVKYLPIYRSTFYKKELNEDQDIITALEDNKIDIKAALRKKMFESDHPTNTAMLYRLLSDDYEFAKLTMTKNDITTNGKDIKDNDITKIQIVKPISE